MTWQRTRLVSVRPARSRLSTGSKGDRFCRDHADLRSQPLSRNTGQ